MGADLTQEYLKSILHYNPDTGIFTWICSRPKINFGDIAGGLDDLGYIRITINGKKYKAHRLAIFYMTEKWPPEDTDHKDLNRSNNKWENIRPSSKTQNFGNQIKYKNNKSGIKGVCWDKDANKWLAQIQFNKKKIKLGRFNNTEDAKNAYAKASKELFKEFARTE